MADWSFEDTASPEYVYSLLLFGNEEVFDLQFTFWNVLQLNKLIKAPLSICIGKL